MQVVVGRSKSVSITAIDHVHWKKAEDVLNESIITEKVETQKSIEVRFESDDFQNFKEREEDGKVLKIEMEKSNDGKGKNVTLIGTREAVSKAKISTGQFIALQATNKQTPAAKKSEGKSVKIAL